MYLNRKYLTSYMTTLFQSNKIISKSIELSEYGLSSLATWFFFTAFTSLRHFKTVQDAADNGKAGEHVVDAVQNLSLSQLAAICCFSGMHP